MEKKLSNEVHQSNSVIHWAERSPAGYNNIAFTCHGCGAKKFIPRSTIKSRHWSGLCADCRRARAPYKLTQDKTLSTGSIIHWSERDGVRVPITCGACGRRRFVTEHSVHSNYTTRRRRRKTPKGFCSNCRRKRYFDDEKTPAESTIHWSERQGRNVPVTCGRCGEKRLVFTGKCSEERFTGFCHGCALGKRTKDELHSSGAIIHWGERQGNHAQGTLKIAFTCHGCGGKHFTAPLVFEYPNWRGLCPDCRPPGRERKFTGDETLWSGAVIRFGVRGPNVEVVCICGDTRPISRRSALGLRRDKNRTGYCPECARNPGRIYKLLKQGSGDDSKQVERRRGPAPKPADKFLFDVRAVVLELYKELASDRAITLTRATSRLQLLGHDLSEGGVRVKIRRKAGKTWEQFVESVLEGCVQVSK